MAERPGQVVEQALQIVRVFRPVGENEVAELQQRDAERLDGGLLLPRLWRKDVRERLQGVEGDQHLAALKIADAFRKFPLPPVAHRGDHLTAVGDVQLGVAR